MCPSLSDISPRHGKQNPAPLPLVAGNDDPKVPPVVLVASALTASRFEAEAPESLPWPNRTCGIGRCVIGHVWYTQAETPESLP